MAPWGPLQRQLMTYLARHPQVQKAVRDAGQRVAAHPSFQKAKQTAYSAFEKAGEKAARGANAAGQAKSGDASGSGFSAWRRKFAQSWQKQMVKAATFIFANIMTIIVLIQFGPMLWHYCKRGMRYLSSGPTTQEAESGEKRRRRKRDGESAEPAFQVEAPDDNMRKAILQSVPQPLSKSSQPSQPTVASPSAQSPWGQPSSSSSLFDDTMGTHKTADVQQSFNDMHKDLFRTPNGDVQVDFNTSFLVKMGDETTFTSSLEREALTGGISKRS